MRCSGDLASRLRRQDERQPEMIAAVGFAMCAVAATLLRVFAAKRFDTAAFPAGTFAVNIIGSFALGLIGGASSVVVTVLGVGALGSLTTFSSLTNEIVRRCRTSNWTTAAVYLALSAVCGVSAAWLGLQIAG